MSLPAARRNSAASSSSAATGLAFGGFGCKGRLAIWARNHGTEPMLIPFNGEMVQIRRADAKIPPNRARLDCHLCLSAEPINMNLPRSNTLRQFWALIRAYWWSARCDPDHA